MANFSFEQWQDRIANRSDLTGMVTHLTKPTETEINNIEITNQRELNLRAVDNLIRILKDKNINGSTSKGFIIGDMPAVCFQEVPIYSLIQNVQYEYLQRKQGNSHKVRYCGVGLSFGKFYVFTKGGRPVIYEDKEKMKKLLSSTEYWRIVNTKLICEDPNIIDWTHEREWRCKNHFEFELDVAHVILYDMECYKYFYEKCPPEILSEIYGVTILKSVLM